MSLIVLQKYSMASIVHLLCNQTRTPLVRTLTRGTANVPEVKEQTPTAVRPITEIPGPKIYPIIGSLPELLNNKYYSSTTLDKLFESLIDHYGNIIRVQNPGMKPIVAIKDPDATRLLNRATFDNPYRPPMASLKKVREEMSDSYFQKKTALINEHDAEWWRIRSKVELPMLKPKNVEMYLADMDAISLDFVERIGELQAEHGEMPSNFQEEFYKFALEMMPKLEFGLQLWRLFPTPNYRKLEKSHYDFLRLIDDKVMDTIRRIEAETEERKKDGTQDNERQIRLIETLLLTPGLSYKDIITFVLDMMFAGIDTTSHTSAFALFLLAKNPEAQKKLQEEVDNVLDGHQGPINKNHMARMSYVKAVIKETFRIFPPAFAFGRTLTKDMIIKGYNIPAGYDVYSLTMLTGWDEKYFKRANEFLPERWLQHKPLGPIHPYASLPFGAGQRQCIGRRLALQEMYVLLTRIMQRFNIDYKYEDIGIKTGLNFKPLKPLKFNFSERH